MTDKALFRSIEVVNYELVFSIRVSTPLHLVFVETKVRVMDLLHYLLAVKSVAHETQKLSLVQIYLFEDVPCHDFDFVLVACIRVFKQDWV